MSRPPGTPWPYRLALFKSTFLYRYFPGRTRAMRALYGAMLSPGDLCFDLGAHIGSRVDVLTSLGCRVVAVEPHPVLADYLRRRFSEKASVIVDARAVSSRPGQATLHWSPRHLTVSSLDPNWLDSLREVRPHRIEFVESLEVEATTIGELIMRYGQPRYCKIDLEGLDLDVIRSLAAPLDIVSFEHLPHRLDVTRSSLAALADLAPYGYNYFVRESHRFRAPAPVTADTLLRELEGIADRGWSCDVYAFRQDAAIRGDSRRRG